MIVGTVIERDGGPHVVVRLADHLGNFYTCSFFEPASWGDAEVNAKVAQIVADLEQRLADAEFEQIVG
jgi:hypothetical protein